MLFRFKKLRKVIYMWASFFFFFEFFFLDV